MVGRSPDPTNAEITRTPIVRNILPKKQVDIKYPRRDRKAMNRSLFNIDHMKETTSDKKSLPNRSMQRFIPKLIADREKIESPFKE